MASGGVHASDPLPRRRDVTWGRALRHGGWGEERGGGRAPRAGTVTHSFGRWGRAQTAPPPHNSPHPVARLSSPRKRRLTALCSGAPRHPSLSSLAHSTSGPPLHSRGTRSCCRGASGNSPNPCARRCPVRPPAAPPPEGGARGRCPMEQGGGHRLLWEP